MANKKTLSEIVEEAIKHALEETNGDRVAAAKMLGIGRTTIYRHLKKLGKSRKSVGD